MDLVDAVRRTVNPVVVDLASSSAELERWRCGRIVTSQGRLKYVQRRWLGYRASIWRVALDRRWRRKTAVECELYYHHNMFSSDYLVLGYVSSHAASSLSSFYCATLVLDEIARIKRSHAIVTEVSNPRLSDRLLNRWGWERHCLTWPGRHFIKRFYGTYPTVPLAWRSRLSVATNAE